MSARSLVAICALASALVHAGPLYRVERAGIEPSFLFGTLHSADPRVTALAPEVREALGRARYIAPELVLREVDLPAYDAGASYEDARRLADVVDAETLAAIRAALGPRAPDDAAFGRLKPWAVMMMLARSGADERPTLDAVVIGEARRRGLAIVGLELPDEQLASFDAIPVASQVALVRWTLAQREAIDAQHEASVRAWLAGDLARLRAIVLDAAGDAPARPHVAVLVRHLVDDRTALMAHRLHLPLRGGRVFVSVGALHLDGPRGLVALLRAQGYRVRRVRRPRGRTMLE